jgi:Ca-activated chloride channel family protein
MHRNEGLRAIVGAIALTVFPITACLAGLQGAGGGQPTKDAAPGQLTIIQKDGKVGALCPLQKTVVNADISGFGARVVVVQTFTNPSNEPIEAVYTFPLPNDAAVDRMRMRIGDRIVEGEIKRREEARAIYEAAKNAGQVASLLDQERPNIFTQSVANIVPGAKIEIEISYVQLLKYEEGEFEFVFPMVVGPRFLGNAPDPGKIAPPITPEGTRTGANIQLTVQLDAGAPIASLGSPTHAITVLPDKDQTVARLSLAKKDEIPNRDFILRYRTATDSVQSAFLTQMDQRKGGFFQLILLPPKAPKPSQIAPKEIIFVIDQSGSQQGFPIEKSKELTLKLIKELRPGDAFNVYGFSNSVNKLWQAPRELSSESLKEANDFIYQLQGNGGTQLRAAVDAALAGFTPKTDRVPIVVFNTDGFVGDETQILKDIRENRDGARMFTFGIGNGCNRYLIDGMSVEGRGDAEYVTLREQADEAVQRFIRRIESPVLTDIKVQFEGEGVTQVLPELIPDVFSEKPIMVCGRYAQAGKSTLVVTGNLGGKPWSKRVPIEFGSTSDASAIPTLWARRQVDELTRKMPETSAEEAGKTTVREQLIQTALDFGIMSQFTSFVAVEKKIVNIGGKQRTVAVPVEMTEGVSYDGIFGNTADGRSALRKVASPSLAVGGRARGGGGGFGGGAMGGAAGKSSGGVIVQEDGSLGVLSPLKEANGQKIDDAAKGVNYARKVSKKLHKATGQVEVQILVKTPDDQSVKKLTELGLKVYQTDKGLKVVFGVCDAKKLIDLAQLDFVRVIDPL